MATVRELVTRLGFKTDEKAVSTYNKRVEGAKRAMHGAKAAAGALAKGFAVVAGAATTASVAAAKLVQEIADLGDQAAKDARKLGISASAVQELGHAARLSGGDFDKIKTSMGVFAKNLDTALVKGAGPAKDALEELGISLDDPRLLSRNPIDALELLADKMQEMPNDSRKTANAMHLMGRSGAELIPLLNAGSEGIREMRQEFRDLGAVIGEDQAAANEEYNDSLERLRAAQRGIKVTIARELLPVFQEAIGDTLEWVKSNRELIAQKVTEWLQRLIPFVRKAFEFVSKLANFIGTLIDRLGGLDKALMIAAAGFTGLQLATSAALGPVGLIAGAFVALLPIAIEVGNRLGDIALEIAGITEEANRLTRLNGGSTVLRGRAAQLARTPASSAAGASTLNGFLEGLSDSEILDLERDFKRAKERGETVTEFAELSLQIEKEERKLRTIQEDKLKRDAAAEEEKKRQRKRKAKERAEAAKAERESAIGRVKFSGNLKEIGDRFEARRFDELVQSGVAVEEAASLAQAERKERQQNNFGLSEKSILDFDPNKADRAEGGDPLAELTGGKLTSGKFGTGERPGFGTQVVNFNIRQEFNMDIDVSATGVDGSTSVGDIEESMRKVARDVFGQEVKTATLEVVPRVER